MSVGLIRLSAAFLLAGALSAGCNKVRQTDMTPLDNAGMHPDTIEQLHKYQVNPDEIQQILTAARAGMDEQKCVELIRLARSRHRVFAEGDDINSLLGAGMKEESVMQLARLDQLTPFAGEAEAMMLAGLSDEVVLDVARHRAKGQAVLAGPRLAELRDAGFSNAQLVAALDQGITDKQADDAIARHNYALGGHTFVRQQGRKR
jgi:hypothetical protein